MGSRMLSNESLYNIIDPFLKGKISPECLKKITKVAMSCLHYDGIERLLLDAVVWGLQFALQLQENAEEEALKPNASSGFEDMDEFKTYEMEDESGEVFSSIGDHVMNSKSTTSFSLTTSDEEKVFVSRILINTRLRQFFPRLETHKDDVPNMKLV
ncbi:hypothetical protein Gohar_015772, partial [Gossypium harknessii]|nr:hypothetical protein [Gossypium harknessii]